MNDNAWRGVLRVLRSILIVSVVMAVWSSITGSFLARWEAKLERTPGLAALLPVLMAATGAAAASVGSRLSTNLHLGAPALTELLRDVLIQGSALLSVTVGYSGAVMLMFSGGITLVRLALTSAGLTFLVSVLVALGSAFVSVRLGMDPDDVLGPVVTTAADFLTVVITLSLAPG